MPNATTAKLHTALREKSLVKFFRPFDEASVLGYVVAIGPQWFLLAVISDGIRFDGFTCFRLSDVRRLQVPYTYTPFVESALKKRGERLWNKPRINLERIETLLRSTNRAFPLITLHREKLSPDTCAIGRIIDVTRQDVSFQHIHPDATWEHETDVYPLREITQVNFGGGYEDALYLVGGPPPPWP